MTPHPILTAMRSGSRLTCDVIDGWALDGQPLDWVDDVQPIKAFIVSVREVRGLMTYKLSRSGVEATA